MLFSRFFGSLLALLFSLNFALAYTRTTSPFEARSILSNRAVVAGTLCANVNVELNVGVLGNQRLLTNICLCTELGVLTPQSVADLRAALNVQAAASGSVTSLVLRTLGVTVDALVETLKPILNTLVGGQPATCDYPDNSTPVCGGACTFTCDDGYYLCGGQCIANTRTCISDVPGPLRKRSRIPTCPNGWSACVVEGSSLAAPSFECVNTKADIDSCGGCMHGSIRQSGLIDFKKRGEDCTAIPGANDISCVASSCQIFSCLRGWVLENGTCVQKVAKLASGSGIYFQQ